ncbi:MAG: NUDIX domain-containing protein [Defluviitaleaceae bacterium]|nr:NUDIX domain-containing protein [Defluviitaleaceae bacterium]
MYAQTAKLGVFNNYIYTVIFAKHKNKWLFCRAKERSVYETAGGRIEPGETPLQAAKRELFEETGAVDFDIVPAFDYSVTHISGETTYGQVFYADIHMLGNMPDYEMAEVVLLDALPESLRFPQITPVLYAQLQDWLYAKLADAEVLDIYDSNRRLTGRTRLRKDPLQSGDYGLIVLVCIMNTRGEFLITKRAPGKSWPGTWEFQGGCASAGDDSMTAAIREAKEEAGIDLKPENGQLLLEFKLDQAFFDVWLFVQDFRIQDVVLQPGETVDAKVATMDDIRRMVQAGEFVRDNFLEVLFEKASQIV